MYRNSFKKSNEIHSNVAISEEREEKDRRDGEKV